METKEKTIWVCLHILKKKELNLYKIITLVENLYFYKSLFKDEPRDWSKGIIFIWWANKRFFKN